MTVMITHINGRVMIIHINDCHDHSHQWLCHTSWSLTSMAVWHVMITHTNDCVTCHDHSHQWLCHVSWSLTSMTVSRVMITHINGCVTCHDHSHQWLWRAPEPPCPGQWLGLVALATLTSASSCCPRNSVADCFQSCGSDLKEPVSTVIHLLHLNDSPIPLHPQCKLVLLHKEVGCLQRRRMSLLGLKKWEQAANKCLAIQVTAQTKQDLCVQHLPTFKFYLEY